MTDELTPQAPDFVADVQEILASDHSRAATAGNTVMVKAYWRIIGEEQGGHANATYADATPPR